MNLFDRTLRGFGLARIKANTVSPFDGASRNRLNVDWAISILSADQEVRTSLRNMRARSRQLANNNDYAMRFLNTAKQNVIGPNGIALQMALDEKLIPGAEVINQNIEDAWLRWGDCATADGLLSFVDVCHLALMTQLQDGEVFVRKVKGYPFNDCRFAVQFLDADQVDVMFQRLRRPDDPTQPNEIRMGVEFDAWRRPVAYHAFEGHPSEMAGIRRIRIPAEEIEHAFIFRRINQTRGVPWMHTAMSRLNMLGGYEEAELVAARLEACKMGYYISKTGEEYTGKKDDKSGAIESVIEPGHWSQLPEGVEPKVVDWQHPNSAFNEFVRVLLRGVAVGLNCSYASISGDLRDVNFSSLRQGVLDEREGWRILQTFARDHIVRPIFADWLAMAITTGEVEVPAKLPLPMLLEAATWTARGWDWVDPYKDGQSDIMAMRSCMGTLADSCAKRGKDWRDQIRQRAKEDAFAKEMGVSLDFTTSGSGGLEGDTAADEPQRGVAPGKAPQPGTAPKKPNGQAALGDEDGGIVRLPI